MPGRVSAGIAAGADFSFGSLDTQSSSPGRASQAAMKQSRAGMPRVSSIASSPAAPRAFATRDRLLRSC